jgi:hypothetical protein
MDAEGARALARRIEQGPPTDNASPPSRNGSSRARPIFGMHIYRTVKSRTTLVGRPAVRRQRIHSTLVDGRWTSAVVEETLQYLD